MPKYDTTHTRIKKKTLARLKIEARARNVTLLELLEEYLSPVSQKVGMVTLKNGIRDAPIQGRKESRKPPLDALPRNLSKYEYPSRSDVQNDEIERD